MHLHLDNKNQFEIKICVPNIFESDFVKDIVHNHYISVWKCRIKIVILVCSIATHNLTYSLNSFVNVSSMIDLERLHLA